MPTIQTLLAFSLAAMLLVVVPGPNLVYIITRGIDQGRRAAIISAFGVETAMLFHIGAAVLGLSALVASSELVFNLVKYAGAAYLIWMGISNVRARPTDLQVPEAKRAASMRRMFLQGVIINVLNPKVGLFFLAFLPQFVDAGRGDSTGQILILGGIFLTIATISDLLYALASGWIGTWLETRAAVARQRERFSGVVYILLGVVAALSGSSSAKNR